MTDAKTTATDLLANLGHEAGDTDTSQPKRDPNLTEVEPDDGFDEEYEFVAPATRPIQPSPDPDSGNEDLADEADWDVPTDLPDSDNSPEAPNESGDDESDTTADEPDAQTDMKLAGAPASLPVPTTRAAEPAQGGSTIVFARKQVRVADVSLWRHAVVDRDHVAPVEVEQRAATIRKHGQDRLPQGRALPDGGYEIANGAIDLFACELIAAQGGPGLMLLEVAPLSEVEMFRHAHSEGRIGTVVLAYDRACSIQAALDGLRVTQKQVAGLLGLDEATVTNSLHILKVEEAMGSVISDPWNITENQAKRFQKLWSDTSRRPLVRKAVREFEVGTARKHLGALFKTFPTASKSEVPIFDAAGIQIGTIRRSATGIVIKLGEAADDVTADDLGAILANAVSGTRR